MFFYVYFRKTMKIQRLIPIIGLIILIVVIYSLDLKKILTIFSSINPFFLILSFLVFIPLLLLVTVEWQLLLKKQKINVSFGYSIKNFFIGYFYGFITIGGFGGYIRAYYLSEKSGAPLPKCFSNIVIFNTIELLAMFVPGFIGAIILSSVYPYLFLLIIIVVALIVFLYFVFFKSNYSKLFLKKIINAKVFNGLKGKIDSSIDSFHSDIPTFKNYILPFLISVSGWIFKYVLLFYVAKLFEINIPFLSFILILAVADVIASIPISIYGVGTREVALLSMFSFPKLTGGIIVGAEQIVSLSLFWFVIIWLTPSIIGFFVTFHESKRFFSFNLTTDNCLRFKRYMKKYQNMYRQLAEIIKKHISNDLSKPLIIDLGVGPGLLSDEIKKIIPNGEIIGIDPSKEMLDLSMENDFIKPLMGSSENIPVKDDSVDIVVSRFNLTYWSDPKKGFLEIHRVLKPGGKFVIEALNGNISIVKLFLIKMHMILNLSGFDVAQYHVDAYKTAYDFEKVKFFFKNTNFTIIHSEGKINDWKFIMIGKK